MFRYHNKDIDMTSIASVFLTILPTLKMFFVCGDNSGSHHSEKFSKSRIFSRKSWHKIQLCEKFSSVNLYLFDVIFSVTAWTNRLHDFNEGICFPDKCCCENE